MSGRLIAKTSHGDPAQFTAEVTSLGACPMSMIPKDANQCHQLLQKLRRRNHAFIIVVASCFWSVAGRLE